MQKTTPAGMNYRVWKNNDYSKWLFTYTDEYHVISEGEDEFDCQTIL
jgi:hypothetical protein